MPAQLQEDNEEAEATGHPTGGAHHDVLLIDDDEDEGELLARALAACGSRLRLSTAATAEQGLARLRSAGRAPALVVFDLHLPGMSGLEALTAMKGDPTLRHIPAIVLTSSADAENVRRAYHACASAYLRKPFDLSGYRRLAEALDTFWGRTTTPT